MIIRRKSKRERHIKAGILIAVIVFISAYIFTLTYSANAPVTNKSINGMVEIEGVVERVISPETVEVKIGGVYETVKLIGIGVPIEMKEDALEYLKREIQGKVATLRYYEEEYSPQVRKYGKIAAYMYIKNILMNGGMIEKGIAITLSAKDMKENPYTRDLMIKLESEAKDKGLGIWSKTKDKASILIDDNMDEVKNKVKVILDETNKQTENLIKRAVTDGTDVIKGIIRNK